MTVILFPLFVIIKETLDRNEILALESFAPWCICLRATGTDVVDVDQGTAVVAEEDNTTAALDVAAMNASVFRGRKRARRTFCDTTTLTFEKFSEYFYLPSEQAAEELQVATLHLGVAFPGVANHPCVTAVLLSKIPFVGGERGYRIVGIGIDTDFVS
nr:hypothetical protein Iba_chr07dCG10800 [Ipomoea batatas]